MRATALAVVVAAALGGCGGPPPASSPTGVVTGTIVLAGGPPPMAGTPPEEPSGAAGTVTAYSGHTEAARQTVGDGERFRLVLPAGPYRLQATNGDARCAPLDVLVTAADELRVRLVCQVK